jgi:hypothetical protein
MTTTQIAYWLLDQMPAGEPGPMVGGGRTSVGLCREHLDRHDEGHDK